MKHIFMALLTAVTLCACTPSEQEQHKDELLGGTTWEWEMLERETDGIVEESIYIDNALAILMWAGVPYTITDEITTGSDTLHGNRKESHATLTFDNGNHCKYKLSTNTSITIIGHEHKWKVLTFEPGVYNNNSIVANIYRDSITISYSGVPAIKVCELTDFAFRQKVEHNILSRDSVSITNTDERTLKFHREGGNVIMQDRDAKFVGTLNLSEWTMSVTQTAPESGDTRIFLLK